MFRCAIQKPKLESIEQKYLEKGHTQNENKSVHACIERVVAQFVFTQVPSGLLLCELHVQKSPHHVKEMDLPDFFDLKSS